MLGNSVCVREGRRDIGTVMHKVGGSIRVNSQFPKSEPSSLNSKACILQVGSSSTIVSFITPSLSAVLVRVNACPFRHSYALSYSLTNTSSSYRNLNSPVCVHVCVRIYVCCWFLTGVGVGGVAHVHKLSISGVQCELNGT